MPATVLRAFVLAALLGVSHGASAQLRLPGALALPTPPVAPLPATPGLPELGSSEPLRGLRERAVRALLRDQAARVEADPAGEPVLRGELLLVSPPQDALDAALAAGYRLRRDETLAGLELRHVVLASPPGLDTAAALARLRAIDARLVADFHHLYTRSGTEAAVAGRASGGPRRVGLIDSGIDAAHPSLRAAELHRAGCNGRALPSVHGTAVASLLVGRDDAGFVGAMPRSALFAADVYCDAPDGGSAESVAHALAWMARERVAVINISLVGPRNALLEAAVRAAVARGHLIVAAVGNDGPAAAPLYPAAYPQVVGVTGVAPSRRVLPEAAQGPQVMFAAPGAELAVARADGSYAAARGTSYAAPLVAGLLASRLETPDVDAAQRVLRQLAAEALDLGAPGRDDVFGHGLVAESLRNAPERVRAAAARRSR